MTHYPVLVFAFSLLILWLAGWIGWSLLRRKRALDEESRQDFGFILAGMLTLLALLIGFSFSMAIGRYDLRKAYEEGEANAIGTEYVRAELLPASDAANIQALLKKYLQERVLFYLAHAEKEFQEINARTAQLQNELWSAVRGPAAAQPTPVVALAVAGMNDVLNSQGYTQAAYWNRIPPAAWTVLIALAVGCSLLIGYGLKSAKAGPKLLPILPLGASIAFMFIADLDAPRHGIMRVRPQNLISLAESLSPPTRSTDITLPNTQANEERGRLDHHYMQVDSPGADKESNWLPTPKGDFYLIFRNYAPNPAVSEAFKKPAGASAP